MGKEKYISFMKKIASDETLARKAVSIRQEAEATGKPPSEYMAEFSEFVKEAGFEMTADELDEVIFYAESIGLSDEELDMAAGGKGIFGKEEDIYDS